MVQRVRGPEPDRAVRHGIRHHGLHLGQLLGRGVLALRGRLAHHGGSPPASMVSAPLSLISPIAAIMPSLTARSARRGSWPRPSTIVAPRMTRSAMTTSVD